MSIVSVSKRTELGQNILRHLLPGLCSLQIVSSDIRPPLELPDKREQRVQQQREIWLYRPGHRVDSADEAQATGWLAAVYRRKLRWWPLIIAQGPGLQGPGHNDDRIAHRVLNVATSVPFVAVGIDTFR